MSKGNVNDIISLEAFKQLGQLDDDLQKVYKTITDINGLSVKPNNLTGIKAYKSEIVNLSKQNEQLNAVTKEQDRLEKGLIRTLAKKELSTESTNRALIKNRFESQQQNKLLKESAVLSSRYSSEIQKLSTRKNQAARAVQNLVAKEAQGIKLSKQEVIQLRKKTAEFKRLDLAYVKSQRAVRRYYDQVGNYKSALAGSGRLARDLVGAFGIVSGIQIASDVVRNMVNLTVEIDGLNKALEKVVPNADEFARVKAFLSDTAEAYGVNLSSLTEEYTKFRASSKGVIDDTRIVDNLFDSVAKSAAAMNLSADDTSGVFRALTQIMSKGKIQAEELRGQLGDRLPGAFNIMAKALNVSTQELDNMLKKGEVLAEEALPKFAKELEKAYGIENTERINTMVSAQNRLNNEWMEFVENIDENGSPINSFLTGLYETATNVLSTIAELNKTDARKLGDSFNNGISEGEMIVETTTNSSMSDENKEIALNEYRLESQKLITQEFDRQRKIKNDILAAERKRDEFQKRVDENFFDTRDAIRLDDMREDIEEGNEALLKSNKILETQKGILKAIADYELSQLKVEDEKIGLNTKGLETTKKQQDYYFKLQEYRLKRVIEINENIVEDEEQTAQLRLQALTQFEERSVELAQLYRDKELEATKGNLEGQELARLKYESRLDDIASERLKKLENFVVDVNDIAEEYGVDGDIESPSFEDSIDAFANFFGFDPEDMLTAWKNYVEQMEKVGEDATLNGFFAQLQDQSQEAKEMVKGLALEVGQEMIQFTNAVFENRQQRYEDDIQRNNDYYSQLLDNEQLTEQQRSQIEAERDAKNAQLEKKKREEQRKQAIFNKVVSIAEIGINTATAVTKASAQLGAFSAPAVALLVALGAAQTAAVVATPIPRYRTGKKKGQGADGMALVNDGGRDEIKVGADGSVTRYTGRNVLDYVKSDDTIYPSVGAFEQQMLSQSLALNFSGGKRGNNTIISSEGIRDEIQKGFKKVKINVINKNVVNNSNWINSKML